MSGSHGRPLLCHLQTYSGPHGSTALSLPPGVCPLMTSTPHPGRVSALHPLVPPLLFKPGRPSFLRVSWAPAQESSWPPVALAGTRGGRRPERTGGRRPRGWELGARHRPAFLPVTGDTVLTHAAPRRKQVLFSSSLQVLHPLGMVQPWSRGRLPGGREGKPPCPRAAMS